MCQEVLRKAGLHEDIFNFMAADEAVEISVCFEEDVIIAPSVCNWYHPVYRMLMIELNHQTLFNSSVQQQHENTAKIPVRI